MNSILVNGEPVTVTPECTVAGLLKQLGIQGDRVAVELNREIVRKPEWGGRVVDAGAQVEIVQFVGGG